MKEFVENILLYERDLFFFMNGSDSTTLDNIMWMVSSTKVWFPFYIFTAGFLFYKTQKKEAALVLFFFILMIVLCDQFSSGLMKPFFERPRPGNHPDFKDLVDLVHGYRGGGFSFISGHATNSFGFAVFLSLVFRYRWVTCLALIWAMLISYSRIYLGVHFVSDVMVGILSGTFIAVILYLAFVAVRKKTFHLEPTEKTQIYTAQHGKIITLVFLVYFISIVLYGAFFLTVK